MKLRQLNARYATNGVDGLEENKTPTVEWLMQLTEVEREVFSTWSVNDLYPLIDYTIRLFCSSVSRVDELPFIQIGSDSWLDVLYDAHGIVDMILGVPIEEASERMKRVLMKLKMHFCICMLHTGFSLSFVVQKWSCLKSLLTDALMSADQVQLHVTPKY